MKHQAKTVLTSFSLATCLLSTFPLTAFASEYYRAIYNVSLKLGKLTEPTKQLTKERIEISFADSGSECQIVVNKKTLPCRGKLATVDSPENESSAKLHFHFAPSDLAALVHELSGNSNYSETSVFSELNIPIKIAGVRTGRDINLQEPVRSGFLTICEKDKPEAHYLSFDQVGSAKRVR